MNEPFYLFVDYLPRSSAVLGPKLGVESIFVVLDSYSGANRSLFFGGVRGTLSGSFCQSSSTFLHVVSISLLSEPNCELNSESVVPSTYV